MHSVYVCMCVVCVHAYLPLGSHHDEFPQDSTLLWGACSCLHVQWGGVADTPGRERRGGGEEERGKRGRGRGRGGERREERRERGEMEGEGMRMRAEEKWRERGVIEGRQMRSCMYILQGMHQTLGSKIDSCNDHAMPIMHNLQHSLQILPVF